MIWRKIMLSNKLPQGLLDRANNPHWENYMKVVFPTMMSYLPGGINYDRDKPMSTRVADYVLEVTAAWGRCLAMKVNLAGNPDPEAKPPTNKERWDFYRDMCYSTNVRKHRQRWKRTMQSLGWNCSDELWRRPDGRDHTIWAAEWDAFQDQMLEVHPLEKVDVK